MNKPLDTAGAPPHATPFEAIGMVLLCFGWFIVASLQSLAAWQAGAGSGRGFDDSSLTGLLLVELVLATAAMAVLQARGYPLQALYPRPSWSGALSAAGLYMGAGVLVNIVLRLVPHPAGAPLADLVAKAHLSLTTIISVAVVNGIYEEVFLLGYLMRGLRRYGASTALGVMLLVRLLYHMYQGPVGALAVVLYGAVVGLYYQRTGRLFPVVLSHVIADAVAFTFI
jgi:membrane protease YdiL (CAAX protease family)